MSFSIPLISFSISFFFIIYYYSFDYYLVMCFKQGLESMMPKVATKISSEVGKGISFKYLWTILAHVLISLTQEDLYPFQSRINSGFYVFISRFLDRLMQLKKIKIPPQKASSWWVVSNCSWIIGKKSSKPDSWQSYKCKFCPFCPRYRCQPTKH